MINLAIQNEFSTFRFLNGGHNKFWRLNFWILFLLSLACTIVHWQAGYLFKQNSVIKKQIHALQKIAAMRDLQSNPQVLNDVYRVLVAFNTLPGEIVLKKINFNVVVMTIEGATTNRYVLQKFFEQLVAQKRQVVKWIQLNNDQNSREQHFVAQLVWPKKLSRVSNPCQR